MANTLNDAVAFIQRLGKKPEQEYKEPDPVADCVTKLRTKYYFVTHPESMQTYYFNGKCYQPADALIQKEAENYLGDDNKNNRTSEIVGAIKRRSIELDKSKFESIPLNLIPVQNGIYDISTGQLMPFTPEYFFTSNLPTIYNKDAECPGFEKFISEVLPEADRKICQEWFGFLLYREYFIHKAMMFLGEGRNGKSTLINVMIAMLGKENCSAESLQNLATNRFSAASLYAKYANLFPDLPPKSLLDSSTFKACVGGDRISAERKNQQRFAFWNYAKLCFSANRLPKSEDDSLAFFERWILLNFKNTFVGEKAEKNKLAEITTEQELSGILNWALEGLRRLLHQQDFSYSKTGDSLREEYIRKSNPVAAFSMDCLVIKPDGYITKQILYAEFIQYCKRNSYPITSEKKFPKDLQKEIMIEDYRPKLNGKRPPCWRGIAFKDMQEEQQDEQETLQ